MKYLESFENYKMNEGLYDYNNLDEANSVYKVIEPFDIYILSDWKESNASIGSNRIMEPIYKKITTKIGDTISNLHGGVFYNYVWVKNQDPTRCYINEPEEFSPFEKGRRKRQEYPLDKLEKIK